MTNVVKLTPVEVGPGYRFDAAQILEDAKGQDFQNLVILGQLQDGEIWVSSMANAGEAMIMMELAKRKIVDGLA